MAEEFKGKMNVAVLVAGPAEEEHDALLHKALLIEKELAKVANVSILGKKLEFYCCLVMLHEKTREMPRIRARKGPLCMAIRS